MKNRPFKVTRHSVKRLKERFGENYYDGKKIKNLSVNKLRKIILNLLKFNRVSVREVNKVNVVVETDFCSFIVTLSFENIVRTTLPDENHYKKDKEALSFQLGEVSEKLRQFKDAV